MKNKARETMEEERKLFADLKKEEDDLCLKNGTDIFHKIEETYPPIGENGQKNYDIILNSLCVSLICLMLKYNAKDNRKITIQIIHKILSNNV